MVRIYAVEIKTLALRLPALSRLCQCMMPLIALVCQTSASSKFLNLLKRHARRP